jgi:thioredoxin reductase
LTELIRTLSLKPAFNAQSKPPGAKPCTAWLPPEIERDEKGFIKTGQVVVDAPVWKGMSRLPEPLETSWPGIFAAGDVRSGSVKRCAAAVGEGGMTVGACTRSSGLTPDD